VVLVPANHSGFNAFPHNTGRRLLLLLLPG
jgi:hypothetical protein